MYIDWSQMATLILALMIATLAIDWMRNNILRTQQPSASGGSTGSSYSNPVTAADWIAQHYPNAETV